MSREFVRVTQLQSISLIELWLPEHLDSSEFTRLNDTMLQTLDHRISGSWLLDLSEVDYMGSLVLGLMVNIRQHIKQGGGLLVLTGLSPRLAQIFHMCCLEKLFKITPTKDEALSLLGGK